MDYSFALGTSLGGGLTLNSYPGRSAMDIAGGGLLLSECRLCIAEVVELVDTQR